MRFEGTPMEPKLILRFRNASKAGTSAEFPVKQFRSVNIGRDHSCEVAYDSDTDDLVSRLHAKITIEAASPPAYLLADYIRIDRFQYQPALINYQRIDPPAVRAVPLGEGFLLDRQRQPDHLDLPSRRRNRQRPPAAANLEQALAGVQVEAVE